MSNGDTDPEVKKASNRIKVHVLVQKKGRYLDSVILRLQTGRKISSDRISTAKISLQLKTKHLCYRSNGLLLCAFSSAH